MTNSQTDVESLASGAGPVHDPTWGFMLRLRRVAQLYNAAWAQRVSADVTSPQFGVMQLLQQSPGASQKEIGVKVSMDKSNTTDVVARLTRRGYVRVLKDPTDKRRNALMLTAEGTRVLAELRPRVDALRATAFAAFDLSQRLRFLESIDTLIDTLSWEPASAVADQPSAIRTTE